MSLTSLQNLEIYLLLLLSSLLLASLAMLFMKKHTTLKLLTIALITTISSLFLVSKASHRITKNTVADEKASNSELKSQIAKLNSQLKTKQAEYKIVTSKSALKKQQTNSNPQKKQSKYVTNIITKLKNLNNPTKHFLVDEKLNISIQTENKILSHFPKKEIINPAATAVYRGKKSKGYSLLIAETINIPTIKSNTDLHELSTSNIESSLTDYKHISASDIDSKDTNISFKRSVCEGKIESFHFRYYISTAYKNGYSYQITSWGNPSFSKQLEDEHMHLVTSFNQIDPDRTYTPSAPPYKNDFVGLEINIEATKWKPNPDYRSNYPMALYGAKSTGDSELIIHAYNSGDLAIPSHLIDSGFLRNEDIKINDNSVISDQIKIHNHNIRYYNYRVTANNVNWNCHMEVAQKGNRHCAIFSWNVEGDPRIDTTAVWKEFSWVEPTKTASSSSLHKIHYASQINRFGLSAYSEKDYSIAAKCFRQAFNLIPTDEHYGTNIIHALRDSGNNLQALKLANKIIKDIPQLKKVHLDKAEILYTLGRIDESFDVSEELFKSGFQDNDHLFGFLENLMNADQHERSVAIMENYEKLHPSSQITRWLASIYQSNKQYDQALKIINKLLKNNPKDLSVISLHCDIKTNQKDYTAALKIIDEWKSIAPNSPEPDLAKAKIFNLKDDKESAHLLLTDLNKKFPDHDSIASAYKRTSASLGLGNNTLISNYISPAPIPEELLPILNNTKEKDITGNLEYQVTYLSKIHSFDVSKPGLLKHTRHYKLRVNNLAGVRAFSTWNLSFNSNSENIYINKLLVKNSTGKTLYQGKLADYYVRDKSDNMATYSKIATVPNKSLEPGSIIELTYTTTQWREDDTIPYKQAWLGGSYPTVFSALCLRGNLKGLQSQTTGSPQMLTNKKLKCWWKENCPIYYSENLAPKLDDLVCRLAFSKEQSSWKDVSKDYYKLIKERLKPNPELTKQITPILAKAESQDEKILTAIRWVQSHCTYRAVEFGARGRMPKDALETFTTKEGDCKDMSLLLLHILREIGIESHLALASTSKHILKDLTSEDQFNHIVLYCPTLPNPVIDPTNDTLDIHLTPPGFLIEDFILPVTEKGSSLKQVKATAYSQYKVDILRQAKAVENRLIITDQATLSGFSSTYYRDNLLNKLKRERIKTIQNVFSEYYPHIIITDVIFTDSSPRNPDPILTITHEHNLDLTSTLPVIWEKLYLSVTNDAARKNKIYYKTPTSVSSTTTIDKSLKIGKLSSIKTDSEFSFNIAIENSKIISQSTINSFKAPRTDYPRFYQNANKLIPKIPIIQ